LASGLLRVLVARKKDLDLTVATPSLEMRERGRRGLQLVEEQPPVRRERGAVARTVEATIGLVETKHAALVRACPRDRQKRSVLLAEEADDACRPELDGCRGDILG